MKMPLLSSNMEEGLQAKTASALYTEKVVLSCAWHLQEEPALTSHLYTPDLHTLDKQVAFHGKQYSSHRILVTSLCLCSVPVGLCMAPFW